MYWARFVSWLVGLSLLSGAVAPARAQTEPPGGTLSTTSATNVNNSNFIVPGSTPGGLTSAQIFSASNFSQDLERALKECRESQSGASAETRRFSIVPGTVDTAQPSTELIASTEPRRFLRGPADPNAPCISPECERLNSLFEEANTFLNGLGAGQLDSGSQTW